ncbi:MAG: 5-(carboxyamino)imidazole ribonucleotide mutase [Chloroflexi bacterium]|nr:5-(carboxyamino)imidazole ribonucleotide mutase [Chloroflexota bacterium]MDA8188302.1 5-(carboxyamino)imidazole ribonucleotide mutase [Dehalococcoidales bacterium]
MALVAVVMGSESDMSFMQNTLDILSELGIEHEALVMSAHRNPEAVREFGQTVRQRGIEVIIAGAGGAAHLPGVLASWTSVPVIGIPLPTSDLNGVDALYAIVQMPAGIPVATVAVGKAGAKNAAYLAAQILGLKYDSIHQAYEAHRARLAQSDNKPPIA